MVERNLRGRMEREKGDGSNLKTLVKEKIVGGKEVICRENGEEEVRREEASHERNTHQKVRM